MAIGLLMLLVHLAFHRGNVFAVDRCLLSFVSLFFVLWCFGSAHCFFLEEMRSLAGKLQWDDGHIP